MELNHQIRLCRPFPFLFGFRAMSKMDRVTTSTSVGGYQIRFIKS